MSGSSHKLQKASVLTTNFLQDFGTAPTQILAVPSLFSPHMSTTQKLNQQSYGAILLGCVFPPFSSSPDKTHKRGSGVLRGGNVLFPVMTSVVTCAPREEMGPLLGPAGEIKEGPCKYILHLVRV